MGIQKRVLENVAEVLLEHEDFQMLGFDEQGLTCNCVSFDLIKEWDDEGQYPNESEFRKAVLRIYNERYAPKFETDCSELSICDGQCDDCWKYNE